jgi:hypothetical protein
MPTITVLQGKARHVSQISNTSGTGQWVQTVHTTQFRVDNRPVVFGGTPNLGKGDHVTIAGIDMPHEFRAYALRNDSTGVEYLASDGLLGGVAVLVFSLVICVMGYGIGQTQMGALLAFPFFCIGVPGIIFGIYLFARARRNQLVNETLLGSAPARALPPHRARTARILSAKVNEPPGFIRTVGGAIVGMLGVGLVACSLILTVLVIIDLLSKRELGLGAALFALALSIASGIGGVSLARWGFRSRRRPVEELSELAVETSPPPIVRQRVLQIASGHGGRVTAAEVAAALAIEQEPAERVLEEAAEAGEARLLFSPDGVAVYEFNGLVTRKAEAKEPWEL